MQDRFNSEFEKFVKQNADQYRMFPSEKVWKGIHSSLHTRKWWYGLGVLLLFITTGVVTGVMYLTPSGKNSLAKNSSSKPVASFSPGITSEKKNSTAIPEKIIIVPAKISGVSNNNSQINSDYLIEENRFLNNYYLYNTISDAIPELKPPVIEKQPASASTLAYASFRSTIKKNNIIIADAIPVLTNNLNQHLAPAPDAALTEAKSGLLTTTETPATNENKLPVTQKKSEEYKERYPLTIESVVNSYKKITRSKKTSWQFYLMPTVSYRKLKENMNFVRAARANGTFGPNVLISYENVNTVVNHKPDLGFELGFNAGFRVTDNFKFITGLQFNVSKYDIRAFNYQNELAIIALNNSNRSTVTAVTPYRSFGNTNKSDWLHNLYISISAPTGIEATFKSKRKVYGGFAATLQPTYNLVNQAYLLSTDFKNYAEVPSLTRKWNLNTSFEIFAGIPSKKLDWRIGPQVRYQALSSFRDDYPLREHLFDFGLKMGIILK